MIKTLTLCLSLTVCASAAAQEPTHHLPHPDIVEQAIATHPVVGAAAARITAAHAEARQRAAGNHDFILSGSYIRRDTRYEGTFSEWDSSISRAVRLPGKAKADRKIGALGVQVAENSYEDARHQVALVLKDYWFAWLSAAATVSVDNHEIATYRRELEAVEKRRRYKDAALLDEEEVRSALAAALARALVNQAKSLEAERALNSMFPDMPLPSKPPEVSVPKALSRGHAEWRKLILLRSHELQMAEKAAEQQMSLARRARLDRYADPSIGVRLFSERGGEESGVGVFFSVPFGLKHRTAASDIQRAKVISAEADVRQTRRLIEGIAERDITRAESGIGIWQQTSISLKEDTAVIKRLHRAVELGDRDLVDLLNALRRHYETQRSEVAARVAAQDALTQLRIDAHEIWVVAHEEAHDMNQK